MNFGLFLARVPLGLYFGIAGYLKVKNGLPAFVTTYLPTAQHYLPDGVARGYLNAVPFAEMLVGALLVLGLFTRLGAFLGAVLLVSFTMATGTKFMEGAPFNSSIVMLGLSLALLTIGPGKLSADMMLFKRKPAGGGGGDKKP